MTDFDPRAVETWALAYLDRLRRPGMTGLLLGGSIARGQQWAHSDLEAGVLVAARDPSLPYFNTDAGRGVEILQLLAPDLAAQLARVEAGVPDDVAQWPIQLWRARVIDDPTGLLARFTAAFDRHLFTAPVLALKLNTHLIRARTALTEAGTLVATHRPRAALCLLRQAMNEAVLALHWRLGELPRSQNRTDRRLKDLTARHNRPAFYALYRQVFDLDSTETAVAQHWPHAKATVLQIAALWAADRFFDIAVDGTFSWGENGGIIAAYRLYIPVIGRPDQGIFAALDDPAWASAHPDLLAFLGLSEATPDAMTTLATVLDQTLTSIPT